MAKSDTNSRLLGHICALFTVTVWGATFIASKIVLTVLSPTQLMSMRFVLAYIFLRIIKPRHPKLVLKDELLFLLAGILGCSLYFWCENAALLYTQTTNVSIIVAAAPILTALIVRIVSKGDKISPNIIYGFIVAMIGIVLVVFNGAVVLKLDPKGDLLALAAALAWALYSALQQSSISKYDPIVFSSKVMFYGFVSSLPLIIMNKEYIIDWEALFTTENVICILFLGLLGSGVCYVLWRIASRNLGIVTTNNYIYLIPFVTMLVSHFVLKSEKITFMAAVGSVLVILGVIICNTRSRKKLK